MHTAARVDDREVTEMLIAAGANVDQSDVDGWTPLMYAKTLEFVEQLLQHQARLDLVNDGGDSVLARCQDSEVIDRLLESSPDPKWAIEGLNESLRQAAKNGDLELIDFLLSRGADVNGLTS